MAHPRHITRGPGAGAYRLHDARTLLVVALLFVATAVASPRTGPGDINVSAADPRATLPGTWTTVHLVAPTGARLCLDRTELPAGSVSFWVRPGIYSVAVFGDSLMNSVATLDARSAPAELALTIARQPDLAGDWIGELAGVSVRVTIEGGRCGQSGCRAGPGADGGVSGSLQVLTAGGTSGDPALVAGRPNWLLRGFDWFPEQHVVTFAALPGGGWGGGGERSFRLHLDYDGSLSGTCTAIAGAETRPHPVGDGSEGGGGGERSGVTTWRQTITLIRAVR